MSLRTSFKPVLQRLLDSPEGSLHKVRTDPDGFVDEILREEPGLSQLGGAIPSLNAVALGVFQKGGGILNQTLPDWWPAELGLEGLAEQAASRPRAPRILFLRAKGERHFRCIYADAAEANAWHLPLAIKETLLRHPESRLLMCIDAGSNTRALQSAAESFGLTGLQQRVAAAVIQQGSGQGAAQMLGVSYNTTREVLSEAARKVRAPNLPALVRRIVESSFGMLPSHFDSAFELEGWLPLTARQCQICELVVEGASRQAVADAMRIGSSVVKKELEHIFVALGVSSATELVRLWIEAKALRTFARETDGAPGFFDILFEPTHFLPRADDRELIAWSDYGPASGKPVLIVHSNWTCRSVPREMVLRLQAAGWRPIAIDRPGFGSTHPGTASVAAPYDQAVADTISVLNRLRIARAAVITRRAGQFTTILKQRHPDRIGPVVLTSPSPPTTASGRRSGIVGVIKEAFHRSPQLIEFYFRLTASQISLDRMERLSRAIAKGSPPDEALCDDPQFIRDRFRAMRPFSTGNLKGAIIEEMQVSRNLYDLAPLDAGDVVIVHGRHDNHYDFDEVREYWRAKLPGAPFHVLEDGGQFLTSSHPALLVELLDQLAASPSEESDAARAGGP